MQHNIPITVHTKIMFSGIYLEKTDKDYRDMSTAWQWNIVPLNPAVIKTQMEHIPAHTDNEVVIKIGFINILA